MSRAIARLEDRVGVRLFDRNARAVALTDDGRKFYERMSPLLTAIEDAFETASSSKARVFGRLRVNVDPFFARFILAERVHSFLEAYPDLTLDVVVRDHADNFIAEGFDAAVRFGEPAESEAGLIARRLLETRIITCASPNYLARRGTPRHPRELATKNHECILFRDPRTGRPFDWEFHKNTVERVEVKGRLLVNDAKTAIGACVNGYGVAQLMAVGTGELFKSGALIDLFPRWNGELFPLYVLFPSKHLPPAKVRAFLDFVVASTATAAGSSSRRRKVR